MHRRVALFIIFAMVVQIVGLIGLPSSTQAAAAPISKIENDDPAVRYTGQWETVRGNYSEGTAAASKDKSAAVTIPFTGTGFAYITSTGDSLEKLEVFVDGRSAKKVTLGSGKLKTQIEVYGEYDLDYGPHEVKIQLASPSNTKSKASVIGFDALGVFVEKPDAPDNLKSIWTGSNVSLTWSKVKNSEGYKVYRSKQLIGGYEVVKTITQSDETSYADALTQGKSDVRYYYVVTTVGNGGQESFPTSLSSTVVPKFVMVPPSHIKTDNQQNVVTIKWSAVDQAVGYKLYRSESRTGTYEPIATLADMPSYVDESFKGLNFSKSKTYYYKLSTLYSNDRESEPSSAVSEEVDPVKGPKPAATIDHGAVWLQWQADAAAAGYRVYRSEQSKGKFEKIAEVGTGVVNYLDFKGFTDIGAKKTFYYSVSTIDRNGVESLLSDSKSIQVSKPPVGQPEVTSTETKSDNSVVLTWSQAKDAAGYYVYRGLLLGDGPTEVARVNDQPLVNTSFTDTAFVGQPIAQDTNYVYYVSAVNRQNVEGPKSEKAIAQVKKTGPLNLLFNGDFESNSQGPDIAGWQTYVSPGAVGEVRVVDQPVSNGLSALRIAGAELPLGGVAMIKQEVAVGSMQSYVLSGSLFAEEFNNAKVQLYIDYYDADGRWVGLGLRESVNVSQQYAPISFETTAPAGAVKAVVYALLRANNNAASGSVYIDDLSFKQQADLTPPAVLSTNPLNGSLGVINDKLEIFFNENISIADQGTSISLFADGEQVPVTTETSVNQLTLSPHQNLLDGRTYTLQISGNAIQDLVGNTLEDPISITFTTAKVNYKNILANPGFEEGQPSQPMPPGWNYYADTAQSQATIVSEPVYAGSNALRLTGVNLPVGGAALLSQRVDQLKGDKMYSSKVKVKVESVSGAKFQWYVDFFDESGKWIGAQSKELEKATDGYASLEVTGLTPSGTTSAVVYAIVRGLQTNGNGTVEIDEASFQYDRSADSVITVQTVEPVNPLLAGSLIRIRFNQAVIAGEMFDQIRITDDSQTIAVHSRVENNQLIIKPETVLLKGHAYVLTVPVGAVVNNDGGSLQTDFAYALQTSNGTELLKNGDFEVPEGWNYFFSEEAIHQTAIVDTEASTGAKAHRIAASDLQLGNVSMLYQEVPIKGETTYRWGGRFKVVDMNNAVFQMYVDFIDVSGNYIGTRIKELNSPTSDYVWLEDSMVAPAGASIARIHLILRSIGDNGSGNMLADTVQFEGDKPTGNPTEEPTEQPPAQPGVLQNGNFELGEGSSIPNWYSYAPTDFLGIYEKAESPVIPGTGALKLTTQSMGAGSTFAVYQDISVVPGQPFTLSGSVLAEQLVNAKGQLFVDFFGENWNWVSAMSADITEAVPSYQQVEASGTVPAGAVKARVYVLVRSLGQDGAGVIYADDLKISSNRLMNGSFEKYEWGQATADYWYASFDQASPVISQIANAQSGKSQQIASEAMGPNGVVTVYQIVGVNANESYRLSGEFTAHSLQQAKGQLYIDFYDASNIWLGSNAMDLTQPSEAATRLEVTGQIPANATFAIVYCILRSEGDQSSGVISFDNVEFTSQ